MKKVIKSKTINRLLIIALVLGIGLTLNRCSSGGGGGSKGTTSTVDNIIVRDFNSLNITTDPITGSEMVADEVIIKFFDGTDEQTINSIFSKYSLEKVGQIPQFSAYQLKIPLSKTPEGIAIELRLESSVEIAIPNYLLENMSVNLEKKPFEYSAELSPDLKYWAFNRINAPVIWGLPIASNSGPIVVIDSGVDSDHSDLQSNIGQSYMSKIINTFKSIEDIDGHGTEVAGIISAIHESSNPAIGIAKNSIFIPIRSDFPVFQDSAAITLATTMSDVRVINYSRGFGGDPSTRIWLERFLYFPLTYAKLSGKLVIAGAGNDGVDVSNFVPANFSTHPELGNNIIAVGATMLSNSADPNSNEVRLELLGPVSNYGAGVDISAPGYMIPTTTLNNGTLFDTKAGTSYAAPFISGIASMLFKVNPSLNPTNIKQIIKDTGDWIDSDGDRIIEYQNEAFPIGKRVNAWKALLVALNRINNLTPPEYVGLNVISPIGETISLDGVLQLDVNDIDFDGNISEPLLTPAKITVSAPLPITITIGTGAPVTLDFSSLSEPNFIVTVTGGGISCTDIDTDGFSIEGGACGAVDCNDNKNTVYPNAPELCDTIDNQCPGDTGYGVVDEVCPWGFLPSLPTRTAYFSAVNYNNNIYTFGGCKYKDGSACTWDNQTFLFNTNDKLWSSLAPMPDAIVSAASTLFNSIIYVFGGGATGLTADKRNRAYDIISNSWSYKPSMPIPRTAHNAVTLGNYIYIIGGNARSNYNISRVDRYDPVGNVWSPVASLNTGRDHAASVVMNGKIYVIEGRWLSCSGGYCTVYYTNSIEEYDPVLDIWTTIFTNATSRAGVSAFALPAQNKIYILGGYDNWNPRSYSSIVEEFDVVTKTIKIKAPMLYPSGFSAYSYITIFNKLRGIIIGGHVGSCFGGIGCEQDFVQIYSPFYDP